MFILILICSYVVYVVNELLNFMWHFNSFVHIKINIFSYPNSFSLLETNIFLRTGKVLAKNLKWSNLLPGQDSKLVSAE